MLDYQIYNTPIETIGRNLLKDFETSSVYDDKTLASPSNNTKLNRDRAVWYIRHYTSNPTPMHLCPDGSKVLRDSAFYNATYADVWGYHENECYDCTDYVSQALHNGGFPLDNTWKPEPLNPAWTRVLSLIFRTLHLVKEDLLVLWLT